MRVRNLLVLFCLFFYCSASAQSWVTDSVTMGPGYGQDVFYSLKLGSLKTVPNNNWHLAFQMTPPGPYGNVSVLANHVQGHVQVYSLHMKASTSFTTLGVSDTVGKTNPMMQLFNTDTSWNYGAFNREANTSNYFDYRLGYVRS